MSYTRRYVTIDKKGRKHVAFRSMGDAAVDPNIEMDCEQMATWQADPVCQQLHPGLFPLAPTAGAQADDPLAAIKSGFSNLVGSVTGAVTSAGTAVASTASGPAAAQASGSGGPSLLVVGALAAGAYFLFGRKKRRL